MTGRDVPEHRQPNRRARTGRGQLTDALQELTQCPDEVGGGVYGVIFSGRRYDTGDRLDYLKAVVQLASERPDLGPELRVWLRSFVADLADEPAVEPKA